MMRTMPILASLLASGLLTGAAEGPNAPFSVQQHEGSFWLTRPDGNRFFSLGVCVVNQGESREQFNTTNPGYAAFQHYANSNRWAEATSTRLKSWGFTTAGGWSDYPALQQCHDADLAFIPVLAVYLH